MIRRHRADYNSNMVANALRSAGATVWILTNVGEGFPDLAVGFRGINYLIEVKNGEGTEQQQRLTEKEKKFHENWRGQKAIVKNIEEALKVIKAI